MSPSQVTTFFWLVICYTQIVLNRVIVARFMADRAASFVDLVSAANLRCEIHPFTRDQHARVWL
jgi:hypothetical protein